MGEGQAARRHLEVRDDSSAGICYSVAGGGRWEAAAHGGGEAQHQASGRKRGRCGCVTGVAHHHIMQYAARRA